MDAGIVSIVVAVIGAIEAVGCVVIGGMISRSNKRNDEYRVRREQAEAEQRAEDKERDEARKELQTKMLDLIFATANGTDVLLQAAHGDQINGNVEEARESIKTAKSECNHLLNKHAATL